MFDKIALLEYTGFITQKKSEQFISLLDGIESSSHIKGVLIKINSGGGDANSSGNIYRKLAMLNRKKVVYSFVDGIAASGGYEIACGTSKIFSTPESLVGGIGVISLKPVIRNLMNKLGVDVEVNKSGRNKDSSLPFDWSSADSRNINNKNIEVLYRHFISIVSGSRSIPFEKVEEIATGDIFIGEIAKEMGLIDGIDSKENVIQKISDATGVSAKKIVFIKPPTPWFSKFFDVGLDAVLDKVTK